MRQNSRVPARYVKLKAAYLRQFWLKEMKTTGEIILTNLWRRRRINQIFSVKLPIENGTLIEFYMTILCQLYF